MKHKRITALLLSVCIITILFSGCKSNNQLTDNAVKIVLKSGEKIKLSKDAQMPNYDSAESALKDMRLLCNHNGTEMYLNTVTGNFALRSTVNNGIWFSSPYNVFNDSKASKELKEKIASNIRVTMVNSSNTEEELLSFRDSVKMGQSKISVTENGFQQYLLMGRKTQQMLLPDAMPATSMETFILPELEGRELSRIKYFYKLYNPEEMSESKIEKIAESYPLVETEPIYVLKSATDIEKEELESYIKKTSYSKSQMNADIEKVGIKQEDYITPYVELLIEYELSENGVFTVNLDTENINYDKDNYVLNKINILEYFASSDYSDSDGFIFLPDGSGTVMNFNSNLSKTSNSLTLKVYGYDMSRPYETFASTSANATIPVYAISSSKGSLLCRIKEGDTRTEINASSGGTVSSYAYVSATFTYRDVDKFDVVETSKVNSWVISDKNSYQGKYLIEYTLMPENSSYTDFALAYRQKLIDEKFVSESIDRNKSLLILGMYGTVDYSDNLLFIPVNKNIPLTTINDIDEISKELKNEGIDDLSIRYLGWTNNGVNQNALNNANPVSVLGSKKDFKNLLSKLKSNNIRLYPDIITQSVKKEKVFDGFLDTKDSIRMLNRQYALPYDYDIASNSQNTDVTGKLINISKSMNFLDKFLNDYKKYECSYISLSDFSSLLLSDKNTKAPYDRAYSKKLILNKAKNITENYKIMTEICNEYMFPYSDVIINLPSGDSGLMQTDYSVPFLQIALHGIINYTSNAINDSGNIIKEILSCAETGSALYFEIFKNSSDSLKFTTLDTLYSADYSSVKDDIVSVYKKYASVFNTLSDKKIIAHKYLKNDVVLIEYEDGTQIVVNYGNEDYMFDGTVILAMDFARLLKGVEQ